MLFERKSLGGMILGAVAGLAPRVEAAAPGAQLVVYVEVPRDATAVTTLTISGMALRGESGTEPLHPLATMLESEELAARGLRLVDQIVPAGFYEALELELGAIEASSGKAMVRPEVAPGPARLPVDRQLPAGGSEFFVIRWTPEEVDPDSPVHLPTLELREPPVPPLGSIAFVTNEGSGNVSVVELASHRVVDVVRTGTDPRGMAYSRIRQRLYVASAGDHSLEAVDGPTLRPIKSALLSYGDEPSRLALSPDESRLYVLDRGSDVLSVLDAETLQEVARAYVGQEPRGMAVHPTSGFVYVASELDSGIRVFDPARPDREILLPAEVAPAEVVVDRVRNRLYVAGANQRVVSVLSIQTQAVELRLNLCSRAAGLAYDPTSRRLFAALPDCREVAVLDPDAALEVDSIRLEHPPGLIALGPDSRELLVTSPSTGELLFYNLNSLQQVGSVAVGDRPFLAVVPR